MADDRFCRFATKLVVNGVTLVDGVLSVVAVDTIVNNVMHQNGLPMLVLKDLYKAKEGMHLHYDITLDGGFIAFEVAALSGPVETLKLVGPSRS